METEILDHFEQKVELAAEIGDLDHTRNSRSAPSPDWC